MPRFSAGGATGRVARALSGADWARKAKHAATTLKSEYAAGRAGEQSEPEPLWGTPREQIATLLALLREPRPEPSAETSGNDPTEASTPDAKTPGTTTSGATTSGATTSGTTTLDDAAQADDQDAADVAEALQGVDWARVRAVTSERSGEATDAMKAMAQQVDWSKVQPVAAQVSSALIAAVASGQLGLGGRLGPTVARAILNQGGIGQRVAGKVAASTTPPPDFRGAIETSAREG